MAGLDRKATVVTAFDYLDIAMVMAVIGTMMWRGAWAAQWGIWAIVVVHVAYRVILTFSPDPVMHLGMAFLLVGIGFLFSHILTIYGTVVASLLFVMSGACALTEFMGWPAPTDQGLGLDLHNFNSACLHVIAITALIAVLRHERIAGLGVIRR